MGFGDFLSGLGNAYLNYTPTGKVIDAAWSDSPHAAAPPGALTGPPPDPSRLQKNADGTATDPLTGQVYLYHPAHVTPQGVSVPEGYQAQQTPNLVQQSGAALNRGAGFFGQVPGYDQREADAYGREAALGDTLTRMALGTGPTVAGTQLAVGQEQAARAQLAQAAGASGNGAVLSRLAAMGNTAGLQAQTNQQQAVARAGEQMGAIDALGRLTSNMVGQSQAAAGQKIGAGLNLTELALKGQGGHEQMIFDANKAEAEAKQRDKDRWLNFGESVASAGTKMG